jgi:hypothetical protein
MRKVLSLKEKEKKFVSMKLDSGNFLWKLEEDTQKGLKLFSPHYARRSAACTALQTHSRNTSIRQVLLRQGNTLEIHNAV